MEKGKKDKIFLDIDYSELSLTCASGSPAIDSGISEFKGIGKKNVSKLQKSLKIGIKCLIKRWMTKEKKIIVKNDTINI